MAFEFVVRVHAMRECGADRAIVLPRPRDRIVIALADGAGGTSHGTSAADAVIDAARALASGDAERAVVTDSVGCTAVLEQLDGDAGRLRGGQTTAVLLVVAEGGEIRGASVGDSEAWLVDYDGRIKALTREQVRKPLLGAGAHVTSIDDAWPGDVTMVVASDGLFRFAKDTDIARIVAGTVAGGDLAAAADQLVALVQTPAGALLDDVSIVLVRRR